MSGWGGYNHIVAEHIKPLKPSFKAVAVEPFNSTVLGGGKPRPQKIQRIWAGFIPDILRLELIDEILQAKDEDAMETARSPAKKEGLLTGISSGAAVSAALDVATRLENAGKLLVVILTDTGERYLSTPLFQGA